MGPIDLGMEISAVSVWLRHTRSDAASINADTAARFVDAAAAGHILGAEARAIRIWAGTSRGEVEAID